VEAKKSDIKSGIGQCIAEMVAAQRFNAKKVNQSLQLMESSLVELWRFLKLEEQTVSIDLFDYCRQRSKFWLPRVDGAGGVELLEQD